MKLDYLSEGAVDSPLIRLYKFNTIEARQFYDVLIALGERKIRQVSLQELPFLSSLHGYSLSLSVNEANVGILPSGDLAFECQLTPESWMSIADLVTPFFNDVNGFQWLDRTSQISLLLSPSGSW